MNNLFNNIINELKIKKKGFNETIDLIILLNPEKKLNINMGLYLPYDTNIIRNYITILFDVKKLNQAASIGSKYNFLVNKLSGINSVLKKKRLYIYR